MAVKAHLLRLVFVGMGDGNAVFVASEFLPVIHDLGLLDSLFVSHCECRSKMLDFRNFHTYLMRVHSANKMRIRKLRRGYSSEFADA